MKLSPRMVEALHWYASTDRERADQNYPNVNTRVALITRGLLTPAREDTHRQHFLTDAGRKTLEEI